ncbi:hypothetical protein RRG08_037134 [Elysia crispata]|uniref:Uncharacterized protein n=1 Tax=Elysia crispata TaxID=231223 RepID=A0AAE0Y5I9_9GAST|nr:hypothetical protein RRG08_037134 [Elysia crispata]
MTGHIICWGLPRTWIHCLYDRTHHLLGSTKDLDPLFVKQDTSSAGVYQGPGSTVCMTGHIICWGLPRTWIHCLYDRTHHLLGSTKDLDPLFDTSSAGVYQGPGSTVCMTGLIICWGLPRTWIHCLYDRTHHLLGSTKDLDPLFDTSSAGVYQGPGSTVCMTGHIICWGLPRTWIHCLYDRTHHLLGSTKDLDPLFDTSSAGVYQGPGSTVCMTGHIICWGLPRTWIHCLYDRTHHLLGSTKDLDPLFDTSSAGVYQGPGSTVCMTGLIICWGLPRTWIHCLYDRTHHLLGSTKDLDPLFDTSSAGVYQGPGSTVCMTGLIICWGLPRTWIHCLYDRTHHLLGSTKDLDPLFDSSSAGVYQGPGSTVCMTGHIICWGLPRTWIHCLYDRTHHLLGSTKDLDPLFDTSSAGVYQGPGSTVCMTGHIICWGLPRTWIHCLYDRTHHLLGSTKDLDPLFDTSSAGVYQGPGSTVCMTGHIICWGLPRTWIHCLYDRTHHLLGSTKDLDPLFDTSSAGVYQGPGSTVCMTGLIICWGLPRTWIHCLYDRTHHLLGSTKDLDPLFDTSSAGVYQGPGSTVCMTGHIICWGLPRTWIHCLYDRTHHLLGSTKDLDPLFDSSSAGVYQGPGSTVCMTGHIICWGLPRTWIHCFYDRTHQISRLERGPFSMQTSSWPLIIGCRRGGTGRDKAGKAHAADGNQQTNMSGIWSGATGEGQGKIIQFISASRCCPGLLHGFLSEPQILIGWEGRTCPTHSPFTKRPCSLTKRSLPSAGINTGQNDGL